MGEASVQAFSAGLSAPGAARTDPTVHLPGLTVLRGPLAHIGAENGILKCGAAGSLSSTDSQRVKSKDHPLAIDGAID